MWLILTFIVVVFGLIYKLLQDHYAYWEKRGVPFEKPVYGLGNAKGLNKTVHTLDIIDRVYKRFKGKAPYAGLYIFFSKIAVLTDLDLVKQVLIKDFNNFVDRYVFHNERDDPVSGILFSIEGDAWRAMRTKLSPVFTSGKIKFMFPTVVAISEQLVKTFDNLVPEGGEGEIKEISARFTTDVIGTCAFAIECNSLKDPQAEFRIRGRAILDKPRHSKIVSTLIQAYPRLAATLRMKFFSDETNNFFVEFVKRTVDYRLKNNVKRNDFMGMLIDLLAKDQTLAYNDGIDLSKGLTIHQMTAQVVLFFFAGVDTSSSTMSFCLYELALHQDIQDKLREEINTVLAKQNGELTYESLKEMHYLEQVVAETLRKYPILTNLDRVAINDYHVPNTNYTIEKGTVVWMPVYSIHHDPEIYPDPQKFDPSRFTPEAIKQRPAAAYLPFGDGPRNCIGMRFGKMQTFIGLIALLRNFKFSKGPRTEVPLELSKKTSLLSSANDIHLLVERI